LGGSNRKSIVPGVALHLLRTRSSRIARGARSDTLPSQKEPRALQAILDRAATDRAFRQRLLVEPRPAILESFGVMIPATFRIKFIERDLDLDALIVLPDMQINGDELSDADLERVSGGVEESAEWSDDGPEEEIEEQF
jgi:hypothetical protein